MPRRARQDAPGVHHHVMIRGIERRDIFLDDADRQDFLVRLDRILPESGMACFGWALMPNHVHLVVRTGERGLSAVMARLNTGYAKAFNERYDRVGHLFQNRFKSFVIADDAYWLTVVRYVHLNPVRARIVRSCAELEAYPWTGHATLIGNRSAHFQVTREVLDQFGASPFGAREAIRNWMLEAEAGAEPRHLSIDDPRALEELIRDRCSRAGLAVAELASGREPARRVRSAIVRAACDELGLPAVVVAQRLGVSQSTVSRARAAGPA